MTDKSTRVTELTRVAIVDDDSFVRIHLADLLSAKPGVSIVGSYEGGRDLIAKIHIDRPDVLLMDIVMPEMDGVEATNWVRLHATSVKVIALTSLADHDVLIRMLQAGAVGYLYKDTPIDGIHHAIMAARLNLGVLPPSAAEALARKHPLQSSHVILSRIDRDILKLICTGSTNEQIATSVHLSASMMKHHIRTLMREFGVTKRVSLAIIGTSLDFG